MAGKGSKKNNDHFEKMKREMNSKKLKASIQFIPEASIEDTNEKDLHEEKHLHEEKDLYKEKDLHEEKEHSISVKKIELVVFRVGEEEFAIRLLNVKEIIRIPSITKIINCPPVILGLCYLRGALLPVINSRKLFGMADQQWNENSRIIVTEIQQKMVGIVSDAVSEVLRVEEAMIKDPPSSIGKSENGIVNGMLILDHGERIVMILDSEKIIKVGEYETNRTNRQPVLFEKELLQSSIEQVKEEQIIIFHVGNVEYAININHVKEITKLTEIMKIPNSARYIEGLLSIRSQLLAVIHLGKLLNINYKEPDEYSRIVIIDDGNFSFGLIVDRVLAVTNYNKNLFVKQSQQISGSSANYLKGFVKLNNGKRLVLVLEPKNLIQIEDINHILEEDHTKIVDGRSVDLGKVDQSDLEHIVIFKIDEQEYGIRIEHIKEINLVSDIVPFPGAPAFIRGMVNLRGEVIPLLNLKTMFHKLCAKESSKYLVAEYENKRIGILIDSASEVSKFPKHYLEEVPDVFEENNYNQYIDKIAKLNNAKRIVLILNLRAVLNFMLKEEKV